MNDMIDDEKMIWYDEKDSELWSPVEVGRLLHCSNKIVSQNLSKLRKLIH